MMLMMYKLTAWIACERTKLLSFSKNRMTNGTAKANIAIGSMRLMTKPPNQMINMTTLACNPSDDLSECV